MDIVILVVTLKTLKRSQNGGFPRIASGPKTKDTNLVRVTYLGQKYLFIQKRIIMRVKCLGESTANQVERLKNKFNYIAYPTDQMAENV